MCLPSSNYTVWNKKTYHKVLDVDKSSSSQPTPNSPNCQTKLTKARVCARPIAIPPTMANSKGRALALSGDKTTKSGAFNNLYSNVREWEV